MKLAKPLMGLTLVGLLSACTNLPMQGEGNKSQQAEGGNDLENQINALTLANDFDITRKGDDVHVVIKTPLEGENNTANIDMECAKVNNILGWHSKLAQPEMNGKLNIYFQQLSTHPVFQKLNWDGEKLRSMFDENVIKLNVEMKEACSDLFVSADIDHSEISLELSSIPS